jgi:anti-sigma factor RsiW
MNDHLTPDQLSDFVDGALAPVDAQVADTHLESCDRCAGELARLRALLAATAALPRNVEPPVDLWGEIRGTLEANKVASLPLRRRSWGLWLPPVAAAIVIAAVWLVARREPVSRVTDASAAPAAVTRIDRHYVPVLDDLAASLRAKVAVAPAKTAATVNQSIRIVDSAIAETRAALIQNPANDRIAEMLSVNYQKKVDLMKRASELATEF